MNPPAVPPRTLARVGLDEALGALRLDRAILLDTETTGLSGGAGTHVFLVGVGWLAEGRFRVAQIHMRDHLEEHAVSRISPRESLEH